MFSKSWVLTRKEFNARATEQVGAVPGRKEWMTIQQVNECEDSVGNLKAFITNDYPVSQM